MPPVEVLLVICGAGPLKDVTELISQVLARGWNVQAMATPSAVDIGLDIGAVREQTGRLVVTSPAVPRIAITPDVIVVAPATVNTITKLALDIRDTYPATVLGQAVAACIPMVILPSIKKVDLDRAIFRMHVQSLRGEGVHLLLGGSNGIHPTNDSTKNGPLPPFPWHLAVSATATCLEARKSYASKHLAKFASPWGLIALTTAIIIIIRFKK
ncbi:Flavoprotein [Mycena sanguinolenta]|uniref:Flavoprotein n=1 Tax=Mycena sanguinolenta TaxID=230812 RepID=A0A8H6U1C3_9AGAR|nr:Flavoprotein [Mycena sanguinolenta]